MKPTSQTHLKFFINSRAALRGVAILSAGAAMLSGCGGEEEVTTYSNVNTNPTALQKVSFTTLNSVASKKGLTQQEIKEQTASLTILDTQLDEAYDSMRKLSGKIVDEGASWLGTDQGITATNVLMKDLKTLSQTLQTNANSETFLPVRRDLISTRETTESLIAHLNKLPNTSSSTIPSEWTNGTPLPAAQMEMTRLMDAVHELKTATEADLDALRPGSDLPSLYKIQKSLTDVEIGTKMLLKDLEGSNDEPKWIKGSEPKVYQLHTKINVVVKDCSEFAKKPSLLPALTSKLADVSANGEQLNDHLKNGLPRDATTEAAKSFVASVKTLKEALSGTITQLDPYQVNNPATHPTGHSYVHHYYPFNYWTGFGHSYWNSQPAYSGYTPYVSRNDDATRYGSSRGYRDWSRSSKGTTAVGSGVGTSVITKGQVVTSGSTKSAGLVADAPSNMATKFNSSGRATGFADSGLHAQALKAGANYSPGQFGGAPAFKTAVSHGGIGANGLRSSFKPTVIRSSGSSFSSSGGSSRGGFSSGGFKGGGGFS